MISLTGPSKAVEIRQPTAIVELFTSQGCSSCPPADKILHKMSMEDELLALAWHVDYWDYLGWKDSFGSPEFSDRQRRYAISLKQRQIYTPQAVINGRRHVVGSKEYRIRETMSALAEAGHGLNVPINVQAASGVLQVDVPIDDHSRNSVLWLVYYNNQSEVNVKRGENRGKKLTYSNIVRDVQMVGMVKKDAMSVTLPIEEMKHKGFDSCALILQKVDSSGAPGAIVGAAIIADLN